MTVSRDRIVFMPYHARTHSEDHPLDTIAKATLGLTLTEIESLHKAAGRDRPLRVVCRPSQFGRFIVARCSSNLQNPVRALNATRMSREEAETLNKPEVLDLAGGEPFRAVMTLAVDFSPLSDRSPYLIAEAFRAHARFYSREIADHTDAIWDAAKTGRTILVKASHAQIGAIVDVVGPGALVPASEAVAPNPGVIFVDHRPFNPEALTDVESC